MPEKNEVTLKVEEPDPTHVGRNIITLDRETKSRLGVTSGDIVEIEGSRKTAAIIWPARAEDEGKGIIRMDHFIRQNAGVGLGEKVAARAAEVKEAKKVVLAPTQEIRIIASGYDRILKKSFLGRPLTSGDTIWVPIFGSGFVYKVIDTNPRGTVKVTDFTQFVLKEKPAKGELEGVPRVAYEDIGGLDEQIQKVREMIELPMKHPELFRRLGIQPPKGVLLHGPPGTGKTLLAKAVANETQAHFISVNAPEIMSKFVGEAEERIRQIFKEAEENAPSIIFIDEIDAIAPKREEVIGEVERRVVAQILASMDGLEARGNVIVIAASVTGDTPILVKNKDSIQLTTIEQLVDPHYATGEEGIQKEVQGLEVLGMKRLDTKHRMPWTYFGASKFQPARGVFRHKVNEIYEIEFNGGKIRTTGNHSVFVRTKYGVRAKRVDELSLNDVLVDLPYKVNRTTSKREVRAHEFALGETSIKLPLYDRSIQEMYALVAANQITPQQASKAVGSHVTTTYSWQRGDRKPDFYRYHEVGIPNEVIVTPELMKLFGYYAAEGYARCELDFCFGAKEKHLIGDVKDLMKRLFNVEPDSVIVANNRCNIVYRKKPLADFFAKYCGKGAHHKKVPSFLFELPMEYFLNFLRAYLDGDGYEYKDGRLEATSVSKSLIMELNWLCRMHGIKSYVHQFTAKEGRTIKGGKPLKETVAYRLGIGKTNNPFNPTKKAPAQGLARIKKITKKPFDGFVYDLCGCEGEAFFGGETPILLHNTNRVNSIDEALRRPGRFDREIEFPVPDKKSRKEILLIHTRGMPLSKDVELDYFASITHGFVGADIAALVKEAAMKSLRRYLPRINLEEERIPEDVLESLEVNRKDFTNGLKDVQPSGLREVAIEIPNVRWEDIGGLDTVKDELKQAVEWPLKNPDAFKKMGIRPPSGILLFGPPGCGKTLLAKAVATESEANFISIKGPELLSMWVGESLPFDEELLVFDGKRIFREKIGKIVEGRKDLQVVTFDNDGRALFSKINDFIKHPLDGKLLQITTKTGRRIRVTDKHSLFSLVENEIEAVTPLQLVEGKSVLAVPSKIPNISLDEKSLNLVELFHNRDDFFIHSPKIGELIRAIGYKAVSDATGLKQKYLYDIVGRGLPLSLKNFALLLGKSKAKFDLADAKVSRKGSRNAMPALFPLSDDFFELLGLWVAEGDFNAGVPRLAINDAEILQKAKGIFDRLGFKYSVIDGRGIVVNSTTLTTLFKEFGLPSGAFNKRTPANLLISPNNLVYAFLRGYFSGDGTIRSNGRSYMIEATTVSEQLANDLMFLLLKLGIVASCHVKKEWSGSISYRIQIFGAENFKKFAPAGFIDSRRNSMIQEYLNKVAWTRSNVIPVNPKIEALLDEAFVNYPQNRAVGMGKLKEALCLIDLNKQRYFDLWKLVEADIFWDVVEKIEEIPYSGFVYDISVEPCQNFLAGFGGIFAHNSEKGIRKIFRRARQVAPCIVFFDEIDSMASKRGDANDSHVGDRVLNQLLTELDGIEAMRNVVFIAATNRPDLLDPGLLRPGRIDKLVKVGAPDEKTRLSILKVHMKSIAEKKMLAEDVDLEEIAKKTPGFSGADLEGLVREAALLVLKENNLKPSPVKKKHFEIIMKKMNPTVTEETEQAYDEFQQTYSSYKPTYVG